MGPKLLVRRRTYEIPAIAWTSTPADNAGKVGVIKLATHRGRCLIHVEMNSGYINDDGKWHLSSYPAMSPPDVGELEVEPPNPSLFIPANPQVYRVYFNHVGLAFYRNDINDIGHDYYLIVPLWLIVTLASLPIAFQASARMTFQRRNPGRCAHCGYDLRATPGRCPECGHVPPTGAP